MPLHILEKEYKVAIRVFKADLVNTAWKSTVLSKKQKMKFFVDVLKKDNSLTATFYAGKYFVEAAADNDLKWNPFITKNLL